MLLLLLLELLRTLLDVVVSQSAAILQLLAGEDQTLLIRGDTCAKGKDGPEQVHYDQFQ